MKKYLKIIVSLVLLFLIYFGITTFRRLELISGFSAKSVASCHFIANRSLENIEESDNDFDVIRWASNEINESEKFAAATVFGLKKRKAIYRTELGATLIDDNFDVNKPYEIPKRTKSKKNYLPFPYGDAEPNDTVFANVDYTKLNEAVANAFDVEEDNIKRTRSVLVIYKDKIIAEKYANGLTKNSILLGWSMTKSITGTLFGILQKQGNFDIYKPAPIPEWQNDDRKNITTNDLLHMNSGLEWDEHYDRICDATEMLFHDEDMSRSQLLKPAVFKPNTHWNYSSGTTNLLSGILRKQFKTHQEYLDFWYSALIDKIGMHSMIVETDMAGNYVGSSYAWATTRDWSKLGLLYLHKGNWNGEQLFNTSWEKYVSTPTNTSNGKYGAHFWLNADGFYPDAPRDMYSCNGFNGQKVFIIPSKDLVIVRLGLTGDSKFDFNGLLKGVVGSVKKE
ncbi:serine hydrolase domain-containing protein [Flavobacterium aquicola]|uniref:CubicO group peptidase (Beta-lactamase class C family) n=1 Tax=Flavobacterium aquicola TaxID=1682742 RepID=A0A3E0EMP9_9FLAO|nr:serine hydrolase [Flavobacterium aquicola]REG98983.1 CubicO group peptidase (beta-lactamase class C family) [Flavobacterium aquicola]